MSITDGISQNLEYTNINRYKWGPEMLENI